MNDKYDRDINYLRVSITDRCNLRCKYCLPKEGISLIGHDDILRYEEILKVIRVTVGLGIRKIRLTGGEPLVRKGLIEFIGEVNAIDGINDISLTTNGILLEAYAEKLFNAGIKRINISLDSLDESKYADITRGGNLQAVLRGIETVNRVGFSPIKINTVVIKGFNENEILDFAGMSLEKPYQIRFIELMPMGGRNRNNQYLSNDLVMSEIQKVYDLESLNGKRTKTDGPARIYKIKGGRGELGFISPVSHHFCFSCNRLRLTADGQLRACLLSDDEVDLKESLRAGCSEDELARIIKSAIINKPISHNLNTIDEEYHQKKCVREMSTIGG
ncbi:MAG: GTP 3',8-cyclase MoaA [Deltaproteobacteria bacterium]|nr:GTP 3',8-cyclase MoaA [Deltaproteobacteria bacterium]